MAHGKRYTAAVKLVPPKTEFGVDKAIELVKTGATAKFDESIDISIRLGVDPRKADQNLRGTVSLPHGAGKKVRVLVITKTGKEKEALAAGADFAGFDEYIEKIKGGWTDIDVIIATPETMVDLGKLGKVLGPRGLMPNPKSGTVTTDITKAVTEVKAGKIEFRTDKAGVVHASVGKASFAKEKLVDNVNAFLSTIMRLKPSSAKGMYVRSITLSSTMGPGVPVDANQVMAAHA